MELFRSFFAGLVGSAYLLYGRRQSEPWFIVTGIALIAYPYIVSGLVLTGLVGVALALLPFVLR